MRKGDFSLARSCYEETLALQQGSDDPYCIQTLQLIARAERSQGHYRAALARLWEALHRSRERYFYFKAIEAFQEIAFTEIISSREGSEAQEPLRRAARLLGAAQACLENDWLKVLVYPKAEYAAGLVELKARLDPATLAQDWSEGAALSVEQAAQYALAYYRED